MLPCTVHHMMQVGGPTGGGSAPNSAAPKSSVKGKSTGGGRSASAPATPWGNSQQADEQRIETRLVGIRHRAAAASYADVLQSGLASLWLCREPHNPVDPNAILVGAAQG